MEPQPPDRGTSQFNQHNHYMNNNHSSANLNNNNNHIHGAHTLTDSNKDQFGSRQGSLTNSTSSERDCDSCPCSGNNVGGGGVCSETESPNDPYLQTADNDVFDWWFHRNRSSKKSR